MWNKNNRVYEIPENHSGFLLFKNYYIYYQSPFVRFYDLDLNRIAYTYKLEGCENFATLSDNKIVFWNIKDDYMYIIDVKEQFIHSYDLQEFRKDNFRNGLIKDV